MSADAFDSVVATHRVVRSFIQEMSRAEHGDHDIDPAAHLPWITSVLPPHFEHEETANGFFDALVRWLPDGEARVRSLVDQHQAMLEDITRLAAFEDPQDKGLQTELLAFAQRLGEHEAEEAELAVACERARAAAGDLEP